jgi:hypothetical protein
VVGGPARLFGPALALPVVLGGGMLSGFVLLGPGRHGEDEDDDDHRGPPGATTPPPPPDDGDPVDWQRFDRLRARWERPRVPSA